MKTITTIIFLLIAGNAFGQDSIRVPERVVIPHAIEWLESIATMNEGIEEIESYRLKPVHFSIAFACAPEKFITDLQKPETISKIAELPAHAGFDVMCNGIGYVISIKVERSVDFHSRK